MSPKDHALQIHASLMHCISDRMCSKNGCWIAKTTPPPSLGKIPLFFSCLLFIEPPYVTTVLQQLEENLKNLFGRKKSKMVARFQSRSLQCSGVRWQGWLGKSPHWHLGSSLLVKKNALEGGLKFIVWALSGKYTQKYWNQGLWRKLDLNLLDICPIFQTSGFSRS